MNEGLQSEEQRLEELRELWRVSSSRGVDSFHPEVKAFYQDLQDKYSNETLVQTKLWHVIVGGSFFDDSKNFDLPNNEIENFIREKLPTLKPKNI